MVNKLAATALLCSCICFSNANATTFHATSKTISAVFKAARAGDTIRLSGVFGYTKLSDKSAANPITLDATRAVFTDTLLITNDTGLRVIGGYFDSSTTSTRYLRAIAVYNGGNISFDHPVVVGNGSGQGIGVTGARNVSITSGRFSDLRLGISLGGVTGASLTQNQIVRSSSDGIDIADSHHVTASHNHCSAGAPSPGAHPDCIQLWSVSGHPVQSDITLSHNIASGPTQGFTSFTAYKGGGLRILILDNTVSTSYPQGVACYGCVDSEIAGNNLTTLAGSMHFTNLHVVGGADNLVFDNTFGMFTRPTPASIAALKAAQASDFVNALREHGPVTSTTSARPAALDRATPVGSVPEPASWVSFVIGFGFIGFHLRHRTRLDRLFDTRRSARVPSSISS